MVKQLGGQFRVSSGLGAVVTGIDMNAAFAMAEALGIDRMAVAVFLPAIEAVAVQKINDQNRQD
ncbi:hypothetical protein [Paenirhodobacter sp. CAU 1674]|uniref:DUF7697 family protein n=1 Tax=Paenirhodobacter sp. CAU 1674 TaxID=3032596 RepID=UPI0023DA881E|nr:hypothetical protein [Paenirhodobacter sp. CAU 1674]MDF2140859.1 hypothetical protein [Paenirhodobacter sp. CAU 1674]